MTTPKYDNKVIGKLSETKIIGGVTAADNFYTEFKLSNVQVNHIKEIEKKAIRYIQSIAQQKSPLYLAYSGGKDSEVLLHIARKSGITFTPFYNNTTIDVPGTLAYIKSKPDIMINQPKRSFFTLIKHRGLPSVWKRFCCNKLKEKYVAPYIFTGVRASESTKRKDRYKEPSFCKTYKGNKKSEIFMPLLYWTDKELEAYIKLENIQCHPVYYDDDGHFNIKNDLDAWRVHYEMTEGVSTSCATRNLYAHGVVHSLFIETHAPPSPSQSVTLSMNTKTSTPTLCYILSKSLRANAIKKVASTHAKN